MLFVKITNPQTGLTGDFLGIIDTGADSCAIPAKYAVLLGYDLKAGRPKVIGTGNGTTRAYSHECRIDIYNTNSLLRGNAETVYTTSEIQIDFMEKLPVILLGVSDFLGQFVLRIDYNAQLFCLQRP
jgi:hypothetical protein